MVVSIAALATGSSNLFSQSHQWLTLLGNLSWAVIETDNKELYFWKADYLFKKLHRISIPHSYLYAPIAIFQIA